MWKHKMQYVQKKCKIVKKMLLAFLQNEKFWVDGRSSILDDPLEEVKFHVYL